MMIDLEACALAGELLKGAGFERRYTSMKSEACYYALPGRSDVIRVAAHRVSRSERWQAPIAVTLTFNRANFEQKKTGLFEISKAKMLERLAIAIGHYMLRTAGLEQFPSKYRADLSRGSIEHPSVAGLHD
jgi:hypothetical protein